jgi:hypothetical protein
MDLDDDGVVPSVSVPEWARLIGGVVLADALAEVSEVSAPCGFCIVTWLMVAAMAMVTLGKRELPPGCFARAGGRGGWSPGECFGAR